MRAADENTLLAHRHDAVEAAAYRDMIAAAPAPLARELGLEARDVRGATLLVAPGLPTPIFNRVIGLGLSAAPAERDLAAIAEVYRAAGVPSWWIHATPGPHFAGLCALLESNGYALPGRRAWACMWRGPNPPPQVASAARIQHARAADAAAIGEVLGGAFGMPPVAAPWLAAMVGREGWIAAVAHLDGRVVGAGMLHRQGNVGWLGVGGVHPEARRTHVHRALMAWRIGEALGHGCEAVSTETGEPTGSEPNPSLRNMEACGFRRLCARLNFAAPAA
jgi:GNAT superfamily N-acetyltransferase